MLTRIKSLIPSKVNTDREEENVEVLHKLHTLLLIK